MKTKISKSKKKAKTKKLLVQKNNKSSVKSKDNHLGDITSLILRDHVPIKKHILVLKDSEIGIIQKKLAYAEFERVLSNHAKAEQESLYIHMKNEDDLCIEGLEGDTEHALADQLMKEIDSIKNDDNLWMAKVKVLAELVDHHVKEEEKEVLKHVQKKFDVNTRIEIGTEYSNLLGQFRDEKFQTTKYTEQSQENTVHA